MPNKLAACPFCAAPAELQEGLDAHGEPFHFIGCTNDECTALVTCRAELDADDEEAMRAATLAWNACVEPGEGRS
jgi:hypothetical protein